MKQYIVDAFTDEVFHGNQAAVCVMDAWPADELMMSITRENNFSETAFAVKRAGSGAAPGTPDTPAAPAYDLRWFTPGGEIDLCGHATLATAYALFRFYEQGTGRVVFHTMSGELPVARDGEFLVMDFPSYELNEVPVTPEMTETLGVEPAAAYLDRDLLLVYENEAAVREMRPDFAKLEQLPGTGLGVTAPGDDDSPYDCVSRFFAPKLKVDEDPVTGSVHCMIAPYWARRLGKRALDCYQASERGGELRCEVRDDGRVSIAGRAALYSVGEMAV